MKGERLLTHLEYALLGLINQEPQTGYSLCKVFETTPMSHYSASPGSIYPALARLEKRGLLEAEVDQEHSMRPKRIYTVTESGREKLREWVLAPVTNAELVRGQHGILLRFGFMDAFARAREISRFLDQLAAETDALVAELASHQRQVNETTGRKITTGGLALGFGISSYSNLARWARDASRDLRNAST
jgi:DNA-binding PadR family transcriptional regulator